MDNLDPTRATVLRFVPDRRFTWAAGLAAVVALGLALFGSDVDGQLLAAIAVLVLLAYVVGDLVFSPRLVASAEGIVIRSPVIRARLRWEDVEDVRADVRSRFGLRSTTLEVDAGAVLAVLSRRALGTDPKQAADLVNALRPS